jgi:hypothetical protein
MLLEINLGVRLGLLILLVLFTICYTARGLQNGIWVFLVTSMGSMVHATLFVITQPGSNKETLGERAFWMA